MVNKGSQNHPLTPRQLEVLELVAKGLTNQEIGDVLGISMGTARNHVAAVLEALDVTNRTEAATALVELGLVEASEPGAADYTVNGFGDRPAIAVLPFDNLSRDPDEDYFADGLVEDLTTRLACYRWFPVIARNSAFAWKGRSVDVKEISKELGARYVVEGSTRRASDRVRVTVQLIDGPTGRHIWADRYDRELTDLFTVQDEIVDTIIGALAPALSGFDRLRATRIPSQNLDAWDCVQRGFFHLYTTVSADVAVAIEWFERAITLDATSSPAFVGLAQALGLRVLWSQGESVQADLVAVFDAATRAVALDPDDAAAHAGLGLLLAMSGQGDDALASLARAVELNPSLANAYFGFGHAHLLGDPDESIRMFERAIRLSPHDPLLASFHAYLGHAHLQAERWAKAREHALICIRLQPENALGHRLRASSCGYLGKEKEALAAMAENRRLVPDFTEARYRRLTAPGMAEREIAGWKKAGWRE